MSCRLRKRNKKTTKLSPSSLLLHPRYIAAPEWEVGLPLCFNTARGSGAGVFEGLGHQAGALNRVLEQHRRSRPLAASGLGKAMVYKCPIPHPGVPSARADGEPYRHLPADVPRTDVVGHGLGAEAAV